MTFAKLIHMGGYGLYIYLAYGVSIFLLLLNVILPLRQFKRFKFYLPKQAIDNKNTVSIQNKALEKKGVIE